MATQASNRSSLFGRWSGGTLHVEDMNLSTGSRFYVHSGTGSSTGGYTPDAPASTIDTAVNLCTAAKGDIIYVMPGHTETISAAAGIDHDTATDVSVIGLGHGATRPKINFATATTADIDIDVDGIYWENIVFQNNAIDALAAPIDVNAANCTFVNCEFNDPGTFNTLDWITLVAASDNCRIINCRNRGTDTAGNQSFVTMGACDGLVIDGLVSNGDFAAANIDMTAAATDCLIQNCRLQNANAVDVCIEGFASATGWVANNYCFIATNGQVTGINTVGTLALFENYQVNNGGETGVLIGTASS